MTDEDRKPDEEDVASVAASDRLSGTDDPPTEVSGVAEPARSGEAASGATGEEGTAVAPAGEADAQAERADHEARDAETRRQVAQAETRRIGEAEGEAEKARQEAEERERELERKETEAREREERARAEADRAREQAEGAARQAREAQERAPAGGATVSAATITSPGIGIGTDPEASALATKGATAAGTSSSFQAAATPAPGSDDRFADLPFGDRPEIQAGIAFAATFLFAKTLKSLGH